MTASAAVPLLRIPPFPNAPARALAHPNCEGADRPSDEAVDEIAAAVKSAKVGGTFWAARPLLPAAPYLLVRIADKELRARTVADLGAAHSLLQWSVSGPADVTGDADPWHLISGASKVVVDADDELALVAALSGVPVQCVGSGQFKVLADGGTSAVRDALRRHAVDNIRYIDPFTGQAISPRDAIALCSFWRSLIKSNRHIAAAVGFASWKRPTVAPLLWGGTAPTPFVSKPGPNLAGREIAIWKSRTDPATLTALQANSECLIEVEDGFIRSIGLGADCVPPLSIIVDRLGVYFDPRCPSDLERLIEEGGFDANMLDRAQRLRTLIVESGISKYEVADVPLERSDRERRHLLVPGQVEDDRSVISGGGDVGTNIELLRRVRAGNPDAIIIYKPHPDVEAGHRTGAIADATCLTLADRIVRDAPISSLIEVVDEVHVNTSLAGFEALMRCKQVTTYGVPFYAGWGLTRDLGPVPARRTARRSLDELVAATLLLYPRYLDPDTGLPCPPEVLIQRLADGGVRRADGPLVWLRRMQGRANRAVSKFWS